MEKESRYNLVALPCGKGGCKPIKVAELQKQMHEHVAKLNSFLDVEDLKTYQYDVSDLRLRNLEDLLDSNSAGSSPTRSCGKKKEGETKEASNLSCRRRTKDRDVSNKRYHDEVICLREQRSKEIEVASTHLATLKRSLPDQSVDDLRSNRNYKCITDGAQRVKLDQEVYRGSRKRVSENEVVLHVAIHLSQTPAFVSEEFLVLGSMTLRELRDVIYCVLDKNMRNVEKEYNKMREQKGIDQKPLFDGGSYFYIEGTFYQDSRYDSSKDLAQPPLVYIKNLETNASGSKESNNSTAVDHHRRQDITLASMEKTTFKDLTIRLGNHSPYLYCHQKCCEHLIVFRDVRMHSCSVDPKYVDQYPFRLAAPGITLEQHRQCEVCSAKPANQVTYEDSRTPHSPFYWCNDCFNRMHYDCSGTLIYSDLRVFPYKHDYQATLLHIPK